MNTQPTSRKDDNLMAALSYVFVLFLIPLLFERESEYVQFHAKQGLVLFIVEVIFTILASVFFFIPLVGWVLYLFVFIMAMKGFVMALQGKKWEMPWLGGYAKKLKF